MTEERLETAAVERTAGRQSNVLYVLPHDLSEVATFLAPAVERVDPEPTETQLLVLTPDSDVAIAVARVAMRPELPRTLRILPVTARRRASRLLKAQVAPGVAGTPGDVLDLVRASALKLEHVRVLVIAWADAIIDAGGGPAMESVLTEVQKDAARILVAGQLTPAVEELVERYARRARRYGAPAEAADQAQPRELRYVAGSAASRLTALRRVLDELDPLSLAVYARSEEARREIETMLATLGYGGNSGTVVTAGEPVGNVALVVLYDLPSPALLRALAPSPETEVVAIVQPRQLGALRALSGGGHVTPLTLPGPGARARSAEERLRAELRSLLEAGTPARELLAIEPLLDDFDGVEVAAAALRLLEQERQRASARVDTPERARGARPAETADRPGMTRVFISAGSRDGVAAKDLVGAIAGEAGVRSDKLGRIELRETHSIVEVEAGSAETIVERLTGRSIRGRRVIAKIDERPAGDSPRRGVGERGRPGGPGRPSGRPGARGGGAGRPSSRPVGRREGRPRADE